MCGIAGIINNHIPTESQQAHHVRQSCLTEIKQLLTAMKHRGPDAMDMRQCSDTVFLGSNRLRITDATNVAADMPMVSKDERFTIVFNGEIYNHQDIRNAVLAERPHYAFTTQSDTETVLAAFAVWGRECVQRFEGMFAIAIHDQDTGTTYLATDPTGQKTLYLHQGHQGLAFASEIDALIADDRREKHWDTIGLQEYISQRFIVGNQTHIAEIKKMEPGTLLTIHPDGSRQQAYYYRVPLGDQECTDTDHIKSEIRRAVINGVHRTASLEVDHALLLSGGIDSTSVLSCLKDKNVTPKTYSTGFALEIDQAQSPPQDAQPTLQDYHFAQHIAKAFATEHDTQLLPATDYCDYLDKWAAYCGEPLGSQEAPCLIKLLESVSQGGAKVVFTGSGPDELFDGYSYGRAMAEQTDLAGLPERYVDTFHWAGDVDLNQLMPNHDWRSNVIEKYQTMLDRYQGKPISVLQAVQLIHFHGRLAVYECRQMDLISMRHSVEARAPLLDKELVQTAFNFAPALKQQGSEKGIFKESLRGVVPDLIIDRKKGAFPIPSEIWFSDEFSQRAQILFDDDSQLVKAGLVDKDYMQTTWNQATPETRNLFSRLYTLEKIMRRQAPYITSNAG